MTNNDTTSDTITRTCGKCEGRGKIAAFAGIANGDCFACGGAGHFVTTEKREKARLAAAKRRKARREATEAERVRNYIIGKMRESQEAGLSIREDHDTRCGCSFQGKPCDISEKHLAYWAEALDA